MEWEKEAPQVQEKQVTPENSLESVIGIADSFVRKQYLTRLQDAQIVPLIGEHGGVKTGRNVRMFQLMSLAYSEEDDFYRKIANIFQSVASFDSSQFLLLDSDGFRVSLYIGLACDEQDKLSTQFNTLKGSFLGNFPGGKISMLNAAKNEELLSAIFDEEDIRISSVSALSAKVKETKECAYSIERLVDGMYGKPFTMLLLSKSVPKQELSELRQSYEAMYTQLSPFREYTVTMNKSSSRGGSQSFSVAKNESISEGNTVTESGSFGRSESRSETESQNKQAEEIRAKNQLMGTALALASIVSGMGAEAAGALHPLQGLFYGGSVSNVLGSVQTLLNGGETARTETTGESRNFSISLSQGRNISRQEGVSTTSGMTDNSSDTAGQGIQTRYENKAVSDLLEVLQEQISRLQHIEETGGFQYAAYFVTGDNSTALTVANMYRSLLGGGKSMGQSNAVNFWSRPESVSDLCEYLKKMAHPKFHFENRPDYPVFTAGTLVPADEIPVYAALPQKSLCGLPVALRAEFARDIICAEREAEDQIEIGRIFHMGRVLPNKVSLSKQDLSGHAFVTGATGMGKSNFCYGLLDSLRKEGIRFMIIEPAKGEYSQVFGGCEDVHVFGTNPNRAPLLRINPFSFPEDVHVNEHIDRLLEIFNACWPMYAAMPEVLKDGLETVYRQCGFNLVTGRSATRHRFPSFSDLLRVLPEIIRQSAFSGEVQGNYIGSLVTRVKSLTDGLYGCIFTKDEIGLDTLFDENVLVDLSRVGSGETKALIMGILVMKLQEYRMSNSSMNSPLTHVTVLEEAHHLLRAAARSSAEGVNLRAMSLEMITNAIAEMRTYGEGFLIADQSPALMDLAVIRNTNTKVVFKLPEQSDRQAVGNAMSLSAAQISEMARLEKGVAVVCQGGWDNAVLAKIRYFDSENFRPYVHHMPELEIDLFQLRTQYLAVLLRDRLSDEAPSSLDAGACRMLLKKCAYADAQERAYLDGISRYLETGSTGLSFAALCREVDLAVDTKKLLQSCGSTGNLEQWAARANRYLSSLAALTENELRELLLLCINIRSGDSEEIRKLYFRYFASDFKNAVSRVKNVNSLPTGRKS